MSFSANFWHNHFRATLFIELQLVVDVLRKRILPQFGNLAAEADEIQKQTWDELISLPSEGGGNSSDFMDIAFNAGYESYSLMHGLNQGIVNLFAVSMFHVHEQHLMIFYKRQLHDPRRKIDLKKLKSSHVYVHLKDYGVYVKDLPSWKSLKEVEWLANAIKHGDGEAAAALRKNRPEFFVDPQIGPELCFRSSTQLDKPLLGEGIYVTPEHLEQLKTAITEFWDDFFELLEASEKN